LLDKFRKYALQSSRISADFSNQKWHSWWQSLQSVTSWDGSFLSGQWFASDPKKTWCGKSRFRPPQSTHAKPSREYISATVEAGSFRDVFALVFETFAIGFRTFFPASGRWSFFLADLFGNGGRSVFQNVGIIGTLTGGKTSVRPSDTFFSLRVRKWNRKIWN
jgi:hypothetical protein